MSDPDTHEVDDAIVVKFSDYYEGTLSESEMREMKALLDEDGEVAAAYDAFKRTMHALSGLHKMGAPPDFERSVERTIHARSRGRFFGRRAFGDRVPFEVLAVLALGLALVLYMLMRSSNTGSLDLDRTDEPEIHEGAKQVVPRP